MTDETAQAPRLDTVAGLASLARSRWWAVVQAAAFGAAAFFAIRAARILNEERDSVFRKFDDGAVWLGVALLATLVFAWTPVLARTDVRQWQAAIARWCRAHWLELLVVGGVLAFGFFMRFYRFQGTLAPLDGLCCEEHINGGVAYRVVEGDRPLPFPLARWASAVGFVLFGEDTFGLRIVFAAFGAAELVVLYLLLRHLVSVPVAIFGLALYAAAWWPSLANRHAFEVTVFFALLMVLFFIRGVKTKSALMFACVGSLAALLSYEYEAFKPVPMVLVAFAAAAAAAAVIFPVPARPLDVAKRALAFARVWWRPALALVMATGIVLTPLIIGTRNGHDLYLTSVHRNEADRGGSRLALNWEDQFTWATELFLPFGPKEYRGAPPLDLPKERLVDPLAASLAVLGFTAGLAFFYRGYRLLFVAWIVAVLGGGSLFLQNWLAWKFISLVPVFLVLAALLVDDWRSWMLRRFGSRGGLIVSGLLVAGAIFSFWWNADKLFNTVDPVLAQAKVYSGERGQFYTYCDYLRDRGTGNHSLAYSTVFPALGFHLPRESQEQLLRAWGDFVWVCHDLDGTQLAAGAEVWPVRSPPFGRTTLVFSSLDPFPELIEDLQTALPALGAPDRVITGAEDDYNVVAWELEDGRELVRTGLWGEYLEEGAEQPAISRVDHVADLAGEEPPLERAFDVQWKGLVYLSEGARLSLQAETNEPVQVVLDGELVYGTLSGQSEERFPDLLEGWHPVEVRLHKIENGGNVRLAWVSPNGGRRSVQDRDTFPMRAIEGWLHERTLLYPNAGVQTTAQRLDFRPHLASTSVLGVEAPGDEFAFVTRERYSGVLDVQNAGTYRLRMRFLAGAVTMHIDGRTVLTASTPSQALAVPEIELQLRAGRHRIVIEQNIDPQVEPLAVWSGMEMATYLVVPRPAGAEPALVEVLVPVLPD